MKNFWVGGNKMAERAWLRLLGGDERIHSLRASSLPVQQLQEKGQEAQNKYLLSALDFIFPLLQSDAKI
jgi:hypothetical protein